MLTSEGNQAAKAMIIVNENRPVVVCYFRQKLADHDAMLRLHEL